MNRQTVVLEIVTAVLLGLVSVGTTLSAYQSTVLYRQAADLNSISQQLRDRNLTEGLSSQLTLQDDGRRVGAAIALQGELIVRPELADDVAAQQEALVAAASPELRDAWAVWVAADFSPETLPLSDPDYTVALFASPQSLQYASFVADGMVDRVIDRAQALAGASVLFALALLVLGVAGVLRDTRAMVILMAVGAALFAVGLVITASVAG